MYKQKLIAAALTGSLLLVGSIASADTRSDRGARTETVTLPPASPVVSTNPILVVISANGSVTSSANSSTNSGGNSGSSVTTGEQTSTVVVTTINGNTTQTVVATPAPDTGGTPATPTCQDRDCARVR